MLSRQAMACRALGSPMYADLLSWAAADLQSGGPTADMLDGYLAQPVSSVLPLRMLGAAHALALTGGWQGAAPPDSRIEVVGRTGGDLDPIDPTTPAGALTLTAYVWPDQRYRLERLRGALTLARAIPADLRRESATATLARTALA